MHIIPPLTITARYKFYTLLWWGTHDQSQVYDAIYMDSVLKPDIIYITENTLHSSTLPDIKGSYEKILHNNIHKW